LHRLVREIAASRRDSAQQHAARRALIAVLATVYPDDGFNNPASWPRCATLTPHLVTICESETADAADSAEHARLLGRAGGKLYGKAAYSAARPLYERALAIYEKALGPEHPDAATSLNNLALVLRDQGDLAAARPLNERALAIKEKALGPEHPDTAASLNNLAWVLRDQDDLVAARPLHEPAPAIKQQAPGRSREGAPPRASGHRGEPQHPRRGAAGPGRLGGGAAPPRARPGNPREGARPRASRRGDEPQQPRRRAAQGPGRPGGGAAPLR